MMLIPLWAKALIIAAICASLYGAVKLHDHKVFKAGQADVQAKWDDAKAKRLIVESAAIAKRIVEINEIAETQRKSNEHITKERNDELAKVRADIASAPRLRVSSTLCARSAAATKAESPGISDATSPASGLLSAQADRAFRQLVEEMEETAATARAAQAFIIANELAP